MCLNVKTMYFSKVNNLQKSLARSNIKAIGVLWYENRSVVS